MDAKQILYNLVYIPIMKRWGDDEHGHHYLLGAFDSLERAEQVAKQEREDRAGKYEYVIEVYSMNQGRDSKISNKMYRVVKSPGMNCMIDSDREEILNDEEKFKKYYEKAERATLLSDLDNARENQKYWTDQLVRISKKIDGHE
jgi:hypothetical protein